jgi:hypothetical protein
MMIYGSTMIHVFVFVVSSNVHLTQSREPVLLGTRCMSEARLLARSCKEYIDRHIYK